MEYIVRIKNSNSFGFFSARSIKDLFDLVDEIIDPFSCEYAEAERYGLFFKLENEELIFEEANESALELIGCFNGFVWNDFDDKDDYIYSL